MTTSLTTVFIVYIHRYIDWLTKKTKTHVVHWSVNERISEPMIHRDCLVYKKRSFPFVSVFVIETFHRSYSHIYLTKNLINGSYKTNRT